MSTQVALAEATPVALILAKKLGLVLCRTAGLFGISPLGPEILPARIRATAALVLALFLLPIVPDAVPAASPLGYLGQVLSEATVGLLAAFLCRLPMLGIEAGMQVISVSAGLGIASLFDPNSNEEVHAVTEIFVFFALVVFFASSGHHGLIAGLASSLKEIPPGAVALHSDSLLMAVRLSAAVFATLLSVAAPVMLVALALQIALALISRAAPAVNIFSVSLVVVLLVGLLSLLSAQPALVRLIGAAQTQSVEAFYQGVTQSGATR